MNIGIIGAGGIARTMAATINKMPTATLLAIASRDLEKATLFAKEFNCPRAYGSYEELVADADIDIVYIATPHSHHFEQAKLCMEHGKHILCEKAFTVTAAQAEELFRLAREHQIVITEAIWTRYMPSRQIINDLLASGIIGEVRTLTANLSYKIDQKERIIRPELAGGALLDVGVYTINFSLMHFGEEIERIDSAVQMTDTGVDGQETITIFYKDGRMAALNAGIYGLSDRHGTFYGSKGYMVIDNINNPLTIDIYDSDRALVRHIDMPKQISGYEYEVEELMETISADRQECVSMPHKDTLTVLKLMDEIREKWGLKYPCE